MGSKDWTETSGVAADEALCVYCGESRATERDHIPPKNLFPKPRPDNLITVPSCSGCNRSASKDDEYFRLVLTIREDIHEHPAAEANWTSVIRGLARPQAAGFRTSLLRSIQQASVRSSAGLYLGHSRVCELELERLDRVAERIVRGLYYYHAGHPLPGRFEIEARAVDTSPGEYFDEGEPLRRVLDELVRRPPRSIGSGIFDYWFARPSDEPESSAWLLLFYRKAAFMGIVA